MNIGKNLVLLSLISMLLISCEQNTGENSSAMMDGVWQSVGYGRIVKIEEGAFKLAEVTSLSCMPILSGNIDVFGDNLSMANDTLRLKNGINNYLFTRIDDAPGICKNIDTTNYGSPTLNFEIVAETFRDHYAYFKERNIDWPATYENYKAQVSDSTSDADLYMILDDMFESFGDGHLGIDAPDAVMDEVSNLLAQKTIESAEKPIDERPPISGQKTRDSIANYYLKDLKSEVFGFLQWGLLNENVGYLQINQMFGYADYGIDKDQNIADYFKAYFEIADEDLAHSDKQEIGIGRYMKQVFADFENTKAIIIDVRFNGGGSDEVGMEVMRFFNDRKRAVFSKQAWYKNKLTPKNSIVLDKAETLIEKPVYLLISPESASATEIMTLTSLEIDKVTRVGDRTEGVFSDVFDRQLPNGMEIGLSNEVYLDMKGNNYEGLGIPADVVINYSRDRYEFFYSLLDDLSEKGDQAIEYVLTKYR